MLLSAFYRENGEWIVTGTNTEFHHLADTVDGVTHYFPQVYFNVFIRRRPAYYILNRILPVVLSSFLVVVVFVLPSESGEKVSYALTELLALAFLLTLITDYMPSTSITISVLGMVPRQSDAKRHFLYKDGLCLIIRHLVYPLTMSWWPFFD